jgi:hypothetical protein
MCRDPNLWVVKCRMGEEKDVVVHLMRKVIAYQFSEEVGQDESSGPAMIAYGSLDTINKKS